MILSNATKSKVCEKKIKTAELKLLKIMTKIEQLKLSHASISRLHVCGKRTGYTEGIIRDYFRRLKYYIWVFFLSLLFFWGWNIYDEYSLKSCLLELPSAMKSLFRPPEDCSMCADVSDVVRVHNITALQFEEKYAYAARPVIVTDAADKWRANKVTLADISNVLRVHNTTALQFEEEFACAARPVNVAQEFSFNFFANFYKNGKMGSQTNDCFFFAYKSGLKSLQEVFSMGDARANLTGAPWYVGWSTCFDQETRALRSYYDRPYFLPTTAESDMIDWIFMGGPGQGAHMHVDSVKHMSWQAQIRGRKQWHLAPPPECLYSCQRFSFTVQPGDILVVDTNRWYHQTNVLPGDISITIGAEYD